MVDVYARNESPEIISSGKKYMISNCLDQTMNHDLF